jgi:PRC-barrel domain
MLESATVVSLEGQYDDNVWKDHAPLSTMNAGLTEIGHVQDIVLTPRGEVRGLTVDVGGFLGIGSKSVLIPLSDIRLARPDPGSDELTVVTRLNQQQLNDLSAFEMRP